MAILTEAERLSKLRQMAQAAGEDYEGGLSEIIDDEMADGSTLN